jgi:hypothetical protein
MGTLWALADALLLAAIVGELFGPRGWFAGGVAALTMPPAWVGFSLMARGNYVEASVLSFLGLYLLLLTARLPPGRGRMAAAAALGASLSFTVWFWPSAWPPSLGPGVLTVAVLGRAQPRLLGVVVAGLLLALLLALLPGLLGLSPTAHPTDPVASSDRVALFTSVLTSPGSWPAFVYANLTSLPLLEPWSPDPGGAAASGEAPA